MQRAWNALLTLLSIAVAIAVPIRLAFDVTHPLVGIEGLRLVQVLFLVDFLWRLTARLRSRRGQPDALREPWGWLVVDGIAALPMVWVIDHEMGALNLVVKALRVARTMGAFRAHHVHWGDELKLAYFAFWVILGAHWIACVWADITPNYSPDGITRYLQALYWVIETLTTIGYGESTPVTNQQRVFALLVMACGVGVYGFVIGNVASMLTNRDPAKSQYFASVDKLNAFHKYRKIPRHTRQRIHDYYAHVWHERLGFDEAGFLETLPGGLRREVERHLKHDILRKIPIFAALPADFVEAVALRLRPDVYVPGEFVCRAGDEGTCMYLIIKGTLEVLRTDGTVIGTLEGGDIFGEVALIHRQPRNASVRAVDYCDVYALDRDALNLVLQGHPDVAEKLHAVAARRSGS